VVKIPKCQAVESSVLRECQDRANDISVVLIESL
jgi:hypothetical protein